MKRSIVPNAFKHYYEDWHFSPVIEKNGTYYFSGVTAARKDKPISSDPEEQFHDAFSKLGVYLESAGLGFEHIVEMTTYHVDIKKLMPLFASVKDKYIKEPYPTWTAIGVVEFIPDNAWWRCG